MKRSNRIRTRLTHPVIDADGHWRELTPVFLDYVLDVAGPRVLQQVQQGYARKWTPWYEHTPEQRRHKRMMRPPYWGVQSNAELRAASTIPALFYEHLDDWGIDVALVYPSLGLGITRELKDPDLRIPVVMAYNTMVAELFKPYADRIIPVGIVGLAEPDEAITLLEHAQSLGLRQVVTGGSIPRPVPEDAEWQSDPRRRRVYLDGLGMDSAHDYDPVWRKFMELKMPVATHSGSMGWPDRNSPSNFVANHLGHFAQSHHLFARSLVLGGVTQRFPGLHFAFLEGGVGWACNLYADLPSHWEKRSRQFMDERLNPARLDRERMRQLLTQYAPTYPRLAGKIDDIVERNLEPEYNVTSEEAALRDAQSDDFGRINVATKDELRHLFADNFYFGCEADDPMTAIAFDERLRLKLKPVLGSDISHFDVVDPREVLGEAYELVEHGLINEANFRDLTFGNAARLFAGMNPDFFKGTIVEGAVRDLLAAEPAPSGRKRPAAVPAR